MTVEWFGDQVLNASKIVLKGVSKEVANNVMEDAKKILKQKAKTTTDKGLLDQFYVEPSKFKDGGYVVWCQGPKNWQKPYHASFFELGTYKDIAHPFMRPAAKMNIRKANKMFQDAMDDFAAKPLNPKPISKKTIDPRLQGGGMTFSERMGL